MTGEALKEAYLRWNDERPYLQRSELRKCRESAEETPICSTGCIERRFGCEDESREYAKCVPMEDCDAQQLVTIIVICALIGAAILIGGLLLIYHKCKQRAKSQAR